MALGFPAGLSAEFVVNHAQGKLTALRRALEDCADYAAWLDGLSADDLQAAPVSLDAASASALKSAFADAAKLAQLYNGGELGTYTLPYNFSASQRVIIGPVT